MEIFVQIKEEKVDGRRVAFISPFLEDGEVDGRRIAFIFPFLEDGKN
jgi:hypothetical protein